MMEFPEPEPVTVAVPDSSWVRSRLKQPPERLSEFSFTGKDQKIDNDNGLGLGLRRILRLVVFLLDLVHVNRGLRVFHIELLHRIDDDRSNCQVSEPLAI